MVIWYQIGTIVFFIGLLLFLINYSFKISKKNGGK
jgi:hypothetical protein